MSCTWLTRREAADYLKVNIATISRWISTGRLKSFKMGPNLRRICLTDLLKAGGYELKEEVDEPSAD